MPSQHKFPGMIVRPDPELHTRAKDAVAQLDSNLNAHVIAFLRWLVHDTDELPQRPDVGDVNLTRQYSELSATIAGPQAHLVQLRGLATQATQALFKP